MTWLIESGNWFFSGEELFSWCNLLLVFPIPPARYTMKVKLQLCLKSITHCQHWINGGFSNTIISTWGVTTGYKSLRITLILLDLHTSHRIRLIPKISRKPQKIVPWNPKELSNVYHSALHWQYICGEGCKQKND